MRAWIVSLAVSSAIFAADASAQDTGVAIVVEDGGGPAADQLARVLDVPTRRAASERAGCAVSPVVVLVGTRDGVVAVRCADGVRLARGVEEAAVVASPYAAALVAAELLDLLAAEPPAQRPVPHASAPTGLAVGVHAEVSAAAAGSADGSTVVVAPRAALDVVLGRRGDGPWAAFGVYAVPFGVRSYALDDANVKDLGYVRHEAGVRALLGVGAPSAPSAVVGVEAGCALALVDAHAADGATIGSDARARLVLGLFGELRHPLAAGLGIVLGLAVGLSPDPTRWLVRGVPVLKDGLVWVNAYVGISFDG